MSPANFITASRIVFVFPIAFAILRYDAMYPNGEAWRYAAFGMYVFSSLTDLLDGYIARRFKCITKLGSVLDPLADKVQCITVILVIAIAKNLGPVPMWYPSIIISKDLVTAWSSLVMWRKTPSGTLKPLALGKVSTSSQNVAIPWLLLKWPGGTVVMIVSAFVGVLAGSAYMFVWLRQLLGRRAFWKAVPEAKD